MNMTETILQANPKKSPLRWLINHKYITSGMYILLVCVILLLCQIVYENIGSISSMTMEEFGSIITLDTGFITPLSLFSASFFHIDMSHLLTNVFAYAILSVCVLCVIWGREHLRKKSMPPYYLLSLHVLTTLFIPFLVFISSAIGWEWIYQRSVNVLGFSGVVCAVLAIFLIQVALLIGLFVYTHLIKSSMKKFGIVVPLFAISWSFLLLWALWCIGTYILYNDLVSMYEGDPVNFFGHLGGYVFGIILALLLEKLPDRIDDVSCEK